MADVDPAHVLFPNDAPTPIQQPEWHRQQVSQAEQRLMGRQQQPSAMATPQPDGANPADRPAGDDADPAKVLFKNEGREQAEKEVRRAEGVLEGYTLDAIKDGDKDRADAIKYASEGLITDVRKTGGNPAELADALQIVRERIDPLSPYTPEKAEAEMVSSMAQLQADGVTEADVNIARAFIRDLEIVAPGTMDTLSRSGAGNDPKIIKAAIKEAKRRGYR